jgi:hypothetical protein
MTNPLVAEKNKQIAYLFGLSFSLGKGRDFVGQAVVLEKLADLLKKNHDFVGQANVLKKLAHSLQRKIRVLDYLAFFKENAELLVKIGDDEFPGKANCIALHTSYGDIMVKKGHIIARYGVFVSSAQIWAEKVNVTIIRDNVLRKAESVEREVIVGDLKNRLSSLVDSYKKNYPNHKIPDQWIQ